MCHYTPPFFVFDSFFFYITFVFKTGFYVTQVGLEFSGRLTWISQSSCFSSSKCGDHSCAHHSCAGFITVNLLTLARRQNIQDWELPMHSYRRMLPCPLPLSCGSTEDSVHWLTGMTTFAQPSFVHLLSWHFLNQVANHLPHLSDVVWPSFAPLRSSFFCSNFKTASSEMWWCKFLFRTASNSAE